MNWYINRGKSRILTATILKTRQSRRRALHSLWEWTKADLQVAGWKDGLSKYDQPSDGLRLYTTPYLIIDYDLTGISTNAALRGVDVRIVTPIFG